MYINNQGHMSKMAAMPIYGINPSKIFYSGTGGQISKNLGVKHLWFKYYSVYINHDPVMTLTQFMGKTVKMSFEGKNQQDISKWTEY